MNILVFIGLKSGGNGPKREPTNSDDLENAPKQSKRALKTTIEWDVKYFRPGAGTVSERLPGDSAEEVFPKSGFDPSQDRDLRARKVWVIEYHTHAKEFIPEGDWIYYSPTAIG